jgi:hypothetical protein
MFKDRLLTWLKTHKLDLWLISVVLVIAATVSAVNMTGYPQRFEDEGTYVSQAWAIVERGTLTHYTYWYDHPPAGWIQMAGYISSTNALHRYSSAITAGREFMLVLHLITILLLFILARRLGIGSLAAGLGTLAYALSPLTVEFSRYVLLDNIGLPWLLAAFILALSPRHHLKTAIGSAICMAIAILSKETLITLLPVLVFALWYYGDKRNRRYLMAAFGVVFSMILGTYILYATLKNELFPGPGHVSLLGTLYWQLAGRQGSGSIFDPHSATRGLISYWLHIDYWLMLAGTIALPIAFYFRKLRVAALGLLVGLVFLLRSGYLPFPYVVALLPFAALTFAGALHYGVIAPLQKKFGTTSNRRLAKILLVDLLIGIVLFVTPTWYSKLHAFMSVDQDASSRQAVTWVASHINHHDNRLVVESGLWTDLKDKGFAQSDDVWLYKTETDPAVVKSIGGWQGINYVILNGPTIGAANFDNSFPTVSQAIKHAKLIAQFGTDNQKILIFKVNH